MKKLKEIIEGRIEVLRNDESAAYHRRQELEGVLRVLISQEAEEKIMPTKITDDILKVSSNEKIVLNASPVKEKEAPQVEAEELEPDEILQKQLQLLVERSLQCDDCYLAEISDSIHSISSTLLHQSQQESYMPLSLHK